MYTLLSERGLVTGCNLSSLSEVMFKEADWHGLGFASALSCWKQPPCCHQSLDNNTQVGYDGYMMQISHNRWHVAVQQAVWWLATTSGPNCTTSKYLYLLFFFFFWLIFCFYQAFQLVFNLYLKKQSIQALQTYTSKGSISEVWLKNSAVPVLFLFMSIYFKSGAWDCCPLCSITITQQACIPSQ